MVSKRMLGLGTARSVIRELFEYGNQRAAVVGRENVYDFSLGNPSVPAPDAVNEAAIRILREQPELIHCYTSAQGDAAARQRFADSLNRRFGGDYTADQFYITVDTASGIPAAGRKFVDNFDSDHVVCETVAYQIFADIKSKRGVSVVVFTNLFAVDIDIGILINAVKTQDNRLSVAS